MPRPLQFDRDTVLRQALDVFWKKGYDGASVQNLVEATGLNRGSLYNSFGDKATLFAEVMALYFAISPTRVLSDAARADAQDVSARTLIVDFMGALVHRAQTDQDHKGCLFTNTAAGFYGCSDAMAVRLRKSLSDMETVFATVVARGQTQGDISSTSSPRAIAHFLLAAAHGLNVMARAGASSETLENIVGQTLSVLD